MLLAFILAPFAEHSFLLKAIQKLYLARTKDENLFQVPQSEKSYAKRKKDETVVQKLAVD